MFSGSATATRRCHCSVGVSRSVRKPESMSCPCRTFGTQLVWVIDVLKHEPAHTHVRVFGDVSKKPRGVGWWKNCFAIPHPRKKSCPSPQCYEAGPAITCNPVEWGLWGQFCSDRHKTPDLGVSDQGLPGAGESLSKHFAPKKFFFVSGSASCLLPLAPPTKTGTHRQTTDLRL